MTRTTKLVAVGVAVVILLVGASAGACKFALACGLDRFGIGTTRPVDAPPIEGGRATLPADFVDTTIVRGLAEPTDFAFLPDGRMLFTQKGGLVRISPAAGGTTTTVIDLRRRVSTFDIRGLLTRSRSIRSSRTTPTSTCSTRERRRTTVRHRRPRT